MCITRPHLLQRYCTVIDVSIIPPAWCPPGAHTAFISQQYLFNCCFNVGNFHCNPRRNVPAGLSGVVTPIHSGSILTRPPTLPDTSPPPLHGLSARDNKGGGSSTVFFYLKDGSSRGGKTKQFFKPSTLRSQSVNLKDNSATTDRRHSN